MPATPSPRSANRGDCDDNEDRTTQQKRVVYCVVRVVSGGAVDDGATYKFAVKFTTLQNALAN